MEIFFIRTMLTLLIFSLGFHYICSNSRIYHLSRWICSFHPSLRITFPMEHTRVHLQTTKEKPNKTKGQKRKIKRKMKFKRKLRWKWRIGKKNFTNLVMWIQGLILTKKKNASITLAPSPITTPFLINWFF